MKNNASKIVFFALIFLIASIVGCKGKDIKDENGKEPTGEDAAKITSWLKRNDPNYPNAEFLIGVGAAPFKSEEDKVKARKNARASGREEIAGFFEAKIKSVFKDETKKIVEIKDKVRHASTSIKLKYTLEESIDKVLEGVEVVGEATDPGKKIIYVLVVMEKQRAAKRINSELKEIKSTIESWVALVETAKSNKRILQVASLYTKIINLMSKFRMKKKEFDIIAPPGEASIELGNFDEGYIINQLGLLTLDLVMMVKSKVTYKNEKGEVTQRDNDPISSSVSKELRNSSSLIKLQKATLELEAASFDDVRSMSQENIKKMIGEAQLLVLTRLEVEITGTQPLGKNKAWSARTFYSVDVIDADTGEIYFSKTSDGLDANKTKAVDMSESQAMNSSMNKAAANIAKDIFNFMNPKK